MESLQTYQSFNQPINQSVVLFPESLKEVILQARRSLKPPEDISVSDWAEKYRILPGYAKLSGHWKNYMVPYMVPVMDAYSNPEVEEISVMASAQVGKTEVMNNMIGWTIDIDPDPILIMQPTIDMAKKYSKEKLEPMIEDTKSLRDKVAKRKSRDSENVTLHKRFVGGFAVLVGANSPHALRQMSIAKVFSDDIDSIEMERGEKGIKEGDPVRRAEYRTKTYRGRRKKVRFSTPTEKDFSRIEKFYNESNKCRVEVLCPHCGHHQLLIFENLKWEKEKDLFNKTIKHLLDTIYYECESCKGKIYEKHKEEMVRNFRLRVERPEIKNHFGIHINELYSLFSTWKEVAELFLACKDDKEALQVFYNLTLGLPFEKLDLEQVPEIDELLKRNEKYLTDEDPYIPNEVLIITAFADVQDDRLEVKCKGWGIGFESWILDYQKLYGDTSLKEVYEDLDKYRQKIFTRRDGLKLGISLTCIDTGGSNTQAVYDYCRDTQHSGVLGTKGRTVPARPILLNRSNVSKTQDVILQNFNTISAKDAIIMRIKNKMKSGYKVMHFTEKFCNKDYFEGLVKSERRERKFKAGIGVQIRYIHDRKIPNEPLDCEVGNIVAITVLNPNFEKTKEVFDREVEEMKKQKDKPASQQDLITTQSGRTRRVSSKRRV